MALPIKHKMFAAMVTIVLLLAASMPSSHGQAVTEPAQVTTQVATAMPSTSTGTILAEATSGTPLSSTGQPVQTSAGQPMTSAGQPITSAGQPMTSAGDDGDPPPSMPTQTLFIVQGPPPSVDLLRGDFYLFPCVAIGFINPPTIEWQIDGTKVDSSVDNAFIIHSNGSLHFWARQASLSGSLACVARSNDGPSTADVTSSPCLLMVVALDNHYTSNPASLTVGYGHVALLNCTIASIPAATISWLKNGIAIQAEGGSSNTTVTMVGDTSYLRVLYTRFSDDGVSWQCLATNPISQLLSVTSAIATVSVRGRPVFTAVPSLPPRIHVGDSIGLSCVADGRPRPSVRWAKPPLHTPIVANTTRLVVTATTLRLTNVLSSDDGQWSCVASNSFGTDSVHFQINVLPMSNGASLTTVPQDATVAPGSTVQLHCVANGNPVPTVTWQKDSVDLDLTSSGVQWQPSTGTLTLYNVQTGSSGVYTCTASNAAGGDLASAVVTVAGRAVISPALINQTVTSGSSLTVICIPASAPGPPLLVMTSWWFNGRLVSSTSMLTFSPALVSQTGRYRCDLTNAVGTTSGYFTLTVQETPVITQSPSDVTILQGSSALLPCNAIGIPVPSVAWLQGTTVVTSTQQISVLSDNTLQIVNADSLNSGAYSCVASNAAGSSSATANVVVIGRVTFTQFPSDTTVVSGNSITLRCAAVAANAAIVYTWYYPNDTRITSSMTSSNITATAGILSIGNVQYSNEGRYTCRAQVSNSLLLSDASAMVTVLVSPSFTTLPTPATVVTGNTAVMHCSASGVPTPVLSWLRNGVFLTSFVPGVSTGRILQGPTGTLTIGSVTKAGDEALYTCVANSTAGVAMTTARLRVLESPKVATSDVVIISPITAHITCVVNAGDPMPVIGWSYGNGTALPGNGRFNVVAGTLAISNTVLSDEGDYLCTAGNSVGQMSVMAFLEVQATPTAQIGSAGQSNVFAHINTNVTFHCLVTGKPPPLVTWGFFASPTAIANTSTTVIQGRQNEQLTLVKVNTAQNGNWICLAQSVAGQNSATTVLTVQVPPGPAFVNILSRTSRSIELDWTFGSDGRSAISNVTIEYTTIVTGSPDNYTSLAAVGVVAKYNITSLQPGTGYRFRVHVYNGVGASAATITAILQTCSVPATSTALLSFTLSNTTVFNLTWQHPAQLNGPLAFYQIQRTVVMNASAPAVTVTTPTPVLVVSDLSVFTEYRFTIQAVTLDTCNSGSLFYGSISDPVVMTTGELVPLAAPLNVTTETSVEGHIAVSWLPPATQSIRGELLGFYVYFRPTEMTLVNYETARAPNMVGDDGRYTYTLQELQAQTSYDIKVQVYNNAGRGPNSTVVPARTLASTGASSGTSAGEIGGIAVGSVCALLFIIFIFLFIQHHRKSSSSGEDKRAGLYDVEDSWKEETTSSQAPAASRHQHQSASKHSGSHGNERGASRHQHRQDDEDDEDGEDQAHDSRYVQQPQKRKLAKQETHYTDSRQQQQQHPRTPEVARAPAPAMSERTETLQHDTTPQATLNLVTATAAFAEDEEDDEGETHFGTEDYGDEDDGGQGYGQDGYHDDGQGYGEDGYQGEDQGGYNDDGYQGDDAGYNEDTAAGYHDDDGGSTGYQDQGDDPDTDLYSMPNKAAKKSRQAQKDESYFDDDQDEAPPTLEKRHDDRRGLLDDIKASPSNHSLQKQKQQQKQQQQHDDEGYEDPTLSKPRTASAAPPHSVRQADDERRLKQQKAEAKKREERDFREWQKQRAKEEVAAEKNRKKVLKEEQKRAEKSAKDAKKSRDKEARDRESQAKKSSQYGQGDWDDFATGTPGKSVKPKKGKKGGGGGGNSASAAAMMMY